jgi:hypothetical protein
MKRYKQIGSISNEDETLDIYRDTETNGIFGIDASIYESSVPCVNPYTKEDIDFEDETLFD